nr:ROK family protein [Odoribacter sp.]
MKKQVTLGIDIGGTNTAFGFIDYDGNYYAEGNVLTNKHEDINDYLKELHLEIEKTLNTIRDRVELVGIGIGAPNGNYYKGSIEYAVNL